MFADYYYPAPSFVWGLLLYYFRDYYYPDPLISLGITTVFHFGDYYYPYFRDYSASPMLRIHLQQRLRCTLLLKKCPFWQRLKTNYAQQECTALFIQSMQFKNKFLAS
jgi:hypothetical protein